MLMRVIFTLSFCLLFTVAFSQKSKEPEFVIRTSCTLRPVKEIPVHIVIKDVSDDAPVLGATVSVFRPFKGDSLHYAANDSGIVALKFPGPDDTYTLSITAVGYEDTAFILSKNALHHIRLQRKFVEIKPVIVLPGTYILCTRRIDVCRLHKIKGCKIPAVSEITTIPTLDKSFKIFPNPASKSSTLNFEFTSQIQGKMNIRIFSVEGRQVLSTNVNAGKGQNVWRIPVDSRLPAGTYIFQLCYANGSTAASGKVIIQ